MRRWLRRIAIGLVILIVAVSVTGVVVFRSDWLRDRLRRLAMTQADRFLAGDLVIGRLSGSLLDGVQLEDVRLADANGVVFQAAHVTVHYDAWTLAHKHWVFDDIEIDRPSVRIAQTASGWNVAHLLRPRPQTGGPADFQVRRLTITDGDVTVSPQASASRRLSRVDANLRFARTGGQFVIDVTALTTHDDSSGYDVRQFAGRFVNGLQSANATFDGGAGTAHIGGRVQAAADAGGLRVISAVDLTSVNLRAFLRDAKWQSDVSGHADVQAIVPATASKTTLAFRFSGPHASAFGYEGTQLSTKGTWSDGRLAFDASANGYGGSGTIRATWILIPPEGALAGFDGAGDFTHGQLQSLPASLKLPPLETDLKGSYRIHYDRRRWHADVTLADSTVEGARVSGGTVGVIDDVAGAISYSAVGSMSGMDLRRLAAPLELPSLEADRYRSNIAGTFSMSGRELCAKCATPRAITASAAVEQATLAGTTITGAAASLSLTGPRLTVAGRGHVSHLDEEAIGGPPSLPLDLNGDVDGSVIFADVHAPVTAENIDVTGTATLTSSAVDHVAFDSARGDVALVNGMLATKELVAEGVGLHLDVKGVLAMGESGSSAFDVTADSDDLAMLGKLLGQPIAGAGHVEAHVTGPHDQPAAAGKMSLRAVSYGSDVSALTVNGDLTATMPQWRPAAATATVKGDSSFVEITGTKLTTVAGQAAYHDGHVDLDATLTDPTRELHVAGDLAATTPNHAFTMRTLALTTRGETWSLADGKTATASMGQSRLEVHGLALAHGPALVSVDGVFPLTAAAAMPSDKLAVTATNIDIGDLNRVFVGAAQNVKGRLDAQATLTGTPDDPTLDGHLTVASGAVEATTFQSFEASATLAAHDLKLDATLVQSGANSLTAVGHIPVGTGATSSPHPMDIAITSPPIDLSLAQLFTTSLSQISGTGEVNLHVTGSPQAPVLDGSVKVSSGAFTLEGSGVAYRDVNAGVRFEKNHLTIDTMELHDDDGHVLSATGGVDVLSGAATRAFDVKVTTQGIHILHNDLGSQQVNANVEVSGDFSAPKVTGTIAIESGRLQVDKILAKTTKSAYSTTPGGDLNEGGSAAAGEPAAGVAPSAAAAGPPPHKGLSDRIAVNLAVTLPDNLVMQGRNLRSGSTGIGLGDMNIIAGGRVAITKPAGGDLSVVGDVEIVRGTYSFQGKRFDISRGSTVQFRGADPSDPSLSVSAERDVNGVAATVSVRGSAKRPQVTLSSVPPLDQAEILSLLIFGQSVGDLGTGDRTALADRAEAMAAGTLTTPLADSVARALDLDTFEILAPSENEQLPVVSVGSTIGSRVYVGLKHEVGGASSAVSFEYRFTHFLRLVTSFAQGALETHALERVEAGGVDLLFVFRY